MADGSTSAPADRTQRAREALKDAQDWTSKTFDSSLTSASQTIKEGSAQASQAYGAAFRRGETFLDTGLAHAKATEQFLFDRLKVGVELCMEYPNTTTGVLGGAALLLLPGLRGFLFRQTLGRLRSEESILRASERRSKDVQERVAYAASEGVKLDSRLTHATEQWQSGLSKTQAAANQLSSLASTIAGIEKSANKVLTDLRHLKKKDALAMRSEVAAQLAAAHQQRRAIEKTLWGLTKKGL